MADATDLSSLLSVGGGSAERPRERERPEERRGAADYYAARAGGEHALADAVDERDAAVRRAELLEERVAELEAEAAEAKRVEAELRADLGAARADRDALRAQMRDLANFEAARDSYLDPVNDESVLALYDPESGHSDLRSEMAERVDDGGGGGRGEERSPFVERVYENERYVPIAGWRKPSLPTDRYEFTDISGRERRPMESVELPAGWRWATNWRIDGEGDVDHEGWEYATDFRGFSWHAKNRKLRDFVRRRRWVRLRERVPVAQPLGSAGAAPDYGPDEYLDDDADVARALESF